MKFTYTGAVNTDLERVRFEIGDRRIGHGPRMDGQNFADGEVNAVLSAEGTWGRAAARLCEVLANEWANRAGGASVTDYGRQAEFWRLRALDLRTQYGGGSQAHSESVTRVDAYSDDVASDDD